MKIQFPVSVMAGRVLLTCSIHVLIWLALRQLAISRADGLSWLRWTTFAGALLPFHFWLVQEAIASDLQVRHRAQRWRAWAFLAAAVALGAMPFTDFFIPSTDLGQSKVVGVGYYFYVAGLFVTYLALGLDGLFRIKTLSGGRRLGVQVWLGAGCAACVLVIMVMLLRTNLRSASNNLGQPIVVLACYAWTALALTSHRTFNPRQFFLLGIEKALFVGCLAAAAGALYALLIRFVPHTTALVVSIAVAWCSAVILRRGWDRTVRLVPSEAGPLPGTAA